MKLNATSEMLPVTWPEFARLHPFAPLPQAEGYQILFRQLESWLAEITGFAAVSLQPNAGSQGEYAGLLVIRAYHRSRGDMHRTVCLIPQSAHGTNPATAAELGFDIEAIPATARGRVDLAALKAKLGADVAAIMVTNPNTCGLFEDEVAEIAEATHKAGAYFYCDGANFNAIVGRVRPADLGVDVMHMNLHKTFSTPHGGGGPGSGPVALAAPLAPFAPLPWVVHGPNGFQLDETASGAAARSIGRLKAFHGQMGMFSRALAYIMSHGADGLKQASEDAVLSANYVMASLKDVMTPAFDGPCMHECLFDDSFLKDTGVSTLDFAKAMIDEGYHPMTMYFPLVVHGALLIEPTESQAKEDIDQFIGALRSLAERAKSGAAIEDFKAAPHFSPRRRLDETLAARKPVLRWRPSNDFKQAAE